MKTKIKLFVAFLAVLVAAVYMHASSVSAHNWDYSRWVVIKWTSDNSVDDYPVYLGGIDFYGKVQSDFDDVRVTVDNSEVDFWHEGFDPGQSSTTHMWTNLDFSGAFSDVLDEAISGSGTPSYIQAAGELDSWPRDGYLQIDDEIFKYTSINNSLDRFTGISRQQMASSRQSHSVSADMEYIEHAVRIFYGDSEATGYTSDDDYMPPFELSASDNRTWHYDYFGDSSGDTSLSYATWQFTTDGCGLGMYTSGSPWGTVGVDFEGTPCAGNGYTYVHNDVGITNITFDQGFAYLQHYFPSSSGQMGIVSGTSTSSWDVEYQLIDEGEEDTVYFDDLDVDTDAVATVPTNVAMWFDAWTSSIGLMYSEELSITMDDIPSVVLGGEISH